MNNSKRIRTTIVLLFGLLFIFFVISSAYLIMTDKDNYNLSWMMFMALMFFGLTLGNVVALLMKRKKKMPWV
ncbi:FtsH-binding integral membrane protein [Paenibacillus sp. PvR052]|nr:FtsH-binding integral membrane protein [Paenibacillus sp. PvP091]MBP1168425.1 FtsH-binding integral membrane protein [Paenibacillus sp. PvR098]MBP2439453.1 FtsH-binding integral membrane protein [Paenibacillus sp. PvP052]